MAKGLLAGLLVAEGGSYHCERIVDGKVIILNDDTGVHVKHFNNAVNDGIITFGEEDDVITPAPGIRTFVDNDGYRSWTNKDGLKKVSELI